MPRLAPAFLDEGLAPRSSRACPSSQVAHAFTVGKSLLAQLDFTGRTDHLARYKPRALAGRTRARLHWAKRR
ncbi:hypothetical protein ACFYRL_34250 [Streptomyces goshikiensis]|uniref:hypothetical protein n=1 Tax=Streptomyces goshikiensis TaxID=1942 RepID=UPI00369A6DFF